MLNEEIMLLRIMALFAFLVCGSLTTALASETAITLPTDVQWAPVTEKGIPPGAYKAFIRGRESDKCGQLQLAKFTDGFVYPWHVNNIYGIYTILKGTLVIGFDKHHAASGEKSLPAGTIMQGLATEPHYGRAIGETIFEIYWLCSK